MDKPKIFQKKNDPLVELSVKWTEDAVWHDVGSEEAKFAAENLKMVYGLIEGRKTHIDWTSVITAGISGFITLSIASILKDADAQVILSKPVTQILMKGIDVVKKFI